MHGGSEPGPALPFLMNGGEMGALIRVHDWSDSPLGPPEAWPPSLRFALSTCLNSGAVGAIYWGPEFRLLYNDGYRPFLNGRHPWALGRPMSEVWPRLWQALAAPARHVLDTGDGIVVDNRRLLMERADGPDETFWSYNFAPIRDDDGTVRGILVTALDITAQVLASRRLDGERERQRQMLRQMPGFAGLLVGPEHRYAYVNDAYVAISGRTDFLGRTVREVFPELEGQGFYELLDRVYATGEPYAARAMPLRLEREDGERFIDFLYEPVRDDDGNVDGIFVGGYDVTERIAAEADLRASAARLRALAELSDRLRLVEEPEELPHAAAEILGRALGVSRVGYGTIDDATETLHVVRDWTAPGVETLAGTVHLRDYGSFIDGLRQGAFIAIADVREDPRTAIAAAALEGRSARSFVNVPVIERGRLVAVLFVNHAYARHWRPDELALIKEVADRTRTTVERHRNEAALRESEARYRTLFEAIDAGFCIIELKFDENHRPIDYRLVEVNPAFERQTGLYGATGQWVSEAAPGLERHWFEIYGRVAATGEAVRFENAAEPLGRWYDVHAFRTGAPDENRVAILFNDISGRKSAEDRLRELNQTLEERVAERTAERNQLWTLTEDMLARADYAGKMSAVNPAWTKVLGWSEEELLTNPYADIIHPDDVGVTVAALRSMGETKQPTRFENRILTSAKEWKPIGWTVAPEADGLNFIAVGRDLADYRARERELLEIQEALRQSQKMEAVGQLTGGIAHDFNNLLAGIVGSLDLMQTRITQGRTEGIERYAKAAMSSAQRAAALTHRLLAFSRRQPLDPRPVNANGLVASIEDLLRRTIGPLHELELVSAGGLWTTLCDPNQLESAILNLAINARDAMPAGGKLVIETANAHLDDAYAAASRDVTPGQYVAICVTDTGCGMAPDVIARAFEPFYTTKPLGQGTGLGLSMVYGFAKQSEGHIKIYSEENHGTTVKIYLPRYRGTADLGDPASPGLDEPARAETGETVLVVEDDAVIRALIVEVLQDLGFRALEAADGPAGLKLLQSPRRIDLLVSDVGLPGLNGRQLADQARETRPDLKVLFITGYAENAAVGNGHLAPGMAVLTKPFAIETMAARIRSMITV